MRFLGRWNFAEKSKSCTIKIKKLPKTILSKKLLKKDIKQLIKRIFRYMQLYHIEGPHRNRPTCHVETA